jgi:hypothetical protein
VGRTTFGVWTVATFFLCVPGTGVGVAAAGDLRVVETIAALSPELEATGVTALASSMVEDRPAWTMISAADAPGTVAAALMIRAGITLCGLGRCMVRFSLENERKGR